MDKILKVIKKNRREIAISIISIIACITYFYVAQIINLPYFNASFVKIVMFCIIPVIYLLMVKEKKSLVSMFKIKKIKDIKFGIMTAIAVIIASIVSLLLINRIDLLKQIAMQASRTIGMGITEYIMTATYIVVVNAFVEEFFFRGVVFLELYKGKSKKYAYIFSAILFSLYHFAIFQAGMQIYLYIIGYILLFVTGIVFSYVNEKSKTIYNSWIVHAIANGAINMIGLYILINLK